MPDNENIYELYDGKIQLKFEPRKHLYTVEGKTVYGVTSVIGIINKPALTYWMLNQCLGYIDENLPVGKTLDEVEKQQLLQEAKYAHKKSAFQASTTGQLVHDWIERYVQGKIIRAKEEIVLPTNKEMRQAVSAFLDWDKKNKVEYLSAERKVFSKKYWYAGTLDIEAIINDKLSIVDIKTSAAIYPDYFLQTAAYIKAMEEEHKKHYKEAWIIRVPKSGDSFEAKKTTKIPEYFRAYLGCLEVYKWQMARKKESLRAS